MMRLDGVEQLLRQLNGMQNIQPAKDKALEAGAEHMREKIAQNTPRSRMNKEHAADNIIAVKESDRYLIGPKREHFYLQFIELGTSKIPANPFLARTFEQQLNKVERIIADTIKEELGL